MHHTVTCFLLCLIPIMCLGLECVECNNLVLLTKQVGSSALSLSVTDSKLFEHQQCLFGQSDSIVCTSPLMNETDILELVNSERNLSNQDPHPHPDVDLRCATIAGLTSRSSGLHLGLLRFCVLASLNLNKVCNAMKKNPKLDRILVCETCEEYFCNNDNLEDKASIDKHLNIDNKSASEDPRFFPRLSTILFINAFSVILVSTFVMHLWRF